MGLQSAVRYPTIRRGFMLRPCFCVRFLMAAAFAGGLASATVIPVVNAGFEDIALAPGEFVSAVPGWTQSGTVGTLRPTAAQFPDGAAEGNNVAVLGCCPAANSEISQDLAVMAAPNTFYMLTVDVGQGLDSPLASFGAAIRIGGVTVVSATTTKAPGWGVFGVGASSEGWVGDVSIMLSATGGGQVFFDQVRFTASTPIPVPEPIPSVLTLFGVTMFAGMLRCGALHRAWNIAVHG